MKVLSQQCWEDGWLLANRTALENCRRICKLPTDHCQELAAAAVFKIFDELRSRDFESCDSFQSQLVWTSGKRVISRCREMARLPTQAGPEVLGAVPEQRVLSQEDASTVTMDEVPDETWARFDQLVAALGDLDRRIVNKVRSTWSDPEKIVQLDRITDVLRLIHEDRALWADLGYGEVNLRRPASGPLLALRKRLARINKHLRDGLQEPGISESTGGEPQ